MDRKRRASPTTIFANLAGCVYLNQAFAQTQFVSLSFNATEVLEFQEQRNGVIVAPTIVLTLKLLAKQATIFAKSRMDSAPALVAKAICLLKTGAAWHRFHVIILLVKLKILLVMRAFRHAIHNLVAKIQNVQSLCDALIELLAGKAALVCVTRDR